MKNRLKALIGMLLCLSLLLAAANFSVNAEVDKQFAPVDAVGGDVDCDGVLTTKDILLYRKLLAKMSVNFCYENGDVNEDSTISTKDLLIIRKKAAGMKVDISVKRFTAEDKDITDTMQDMGIPYLSDWPDSGGVEKIISRNPYDMTAYNGKVFISAGNYNTNQGPVNVVFYTRTSTKSKMTSDLQTEQVNKFYVYDNTLYTLAVDPCTWLTGEYYQFNPDKNKWITRNKLANNIHCYDMVQHNGQYFFCGSNDKTLYSEEYQKDIEMSVGSVFRFTGDTLNNSSTSQYVDVPFIDKYGDTVSYYDAAGVPRVYDMAEFNGCLYAYYYDYYISEYPEYYDDRDSNNGVYKYNDEKQQFEYCEGMSFDTPFLNLGFRQDLEGVMKDFQWNDNYVCINNGLFITPDLKSWQQKKIKGFEDYVICDAEVIGNEVFLLANIKNEDGSYTNGIFKTTDFENYSRVVHMNTKNFVRSFAYTDGAFFFGVGTSKADALTDSGKECGRVYRYLYYN